MADTSPSLLERLRRAPRGDDWPRWLALYTPLLTQWLCRFGLQAADADDVVQDVLAAVVRDLPAFEHNQRAGAFRRWLRGILVHRVQEFWRKRSNRARLEGEPARELDELQDPGSGLSQLFERQHDQHVLRRLLEMIEPQVTPQTWQAFRRVVLDGQDEEAAAKELGISVNAVFIAKSRVLARLRREAQGLVD